MKTRVYIDASNLFYGGEKSLGWKIDYEKLFRYLKNKYQAEEILYFGGVELHGYKYDYLRQDTVPLNELKDYLDNLIIKRGKGWDTSKMILFSGHVKRIKFYLKLKRFGYKLFLKPVKLYYQENGSVKNKANCDVEMAFYMIKDKDEYDRMILLSGDGDFLPVLKYLRVMGKEIIILARGSRAAKEIRQFAASRFRDFEYLRNLLKMDEKRK
jgi:uncharacterized LabA/DUF88 family protein